ncbi:MAG: hypothetical protein OQK98_04360 [Gammaproteobacteria bacterium]|nr:hypothetical protein [Gammaproteobacteria bacterium]
MRYLGVIVSLVLFSFPAFSADMTDEERCLKLGEVAEKASNMRISGADKDTATSTLIKMYDQPGSGVTTSNVRGMVMISYMARMEPKKMRDYAIAECKKDILK